MFNLAFLDLITGALGAVIFLFIITPKGGSSAATTSQVVMYVDTAQMKVFGSLDDSLRTKQVGDTLMTVLVDYKNFPKPEKRKVEEKKIDFNQPKARPVAVVSKPVDRKPTPAPPKPEKKPVPITEGPKQSEVFTGDAPSVPCKVSFELNWKNQADNVDLFVCKGGECVYGGRKRVKGVGEWDSGKSRNRLFGNDLRTNQESVRQFNEVIPGTYDIYAQFKQSKAGNNSVLLKGLIYTKGTSGKPQGETFIKTLLLSKKRVHIGQVILKRDGSYEFIRK